MGRSSPYGEQIDPLGNAVSLAQHAEKRAKSNRNVQEMIAASSQWLSIAMIHKEIYENEQPNNKQVGFTGGEK